MTGLKTRIISSIIAMGLIVLMLYLKGIVFIGGLCAVALIAVHELNSAFTNKGHRPNLLLSMAMVLIIIAITVFGSRLVVESKFNFSMLILGLSTLCFFILLFLFLLNHRDPIDIMISFFAAIYVGIPIAMILIMMNVPINLLILIIPIANDSFAYFTGMAIGKHKMAPKISPKKTWEGAIGAVVGTIIALFVAKWMLYPEITLLGGLIIAIIGSVMAQMGDLTASVLKRYCNVKDFGTIMPGHGGIIDRLDSIIFVVPVIFLVYFFQSLGVL